MDTNNQVTIVLQGCIHTFELLEKIIDEYNKFANIVVSTYFVNYLENINCMILKYPNITFIDNNLEKYKNELIENNNYCESQSNEQNNYMNNYYYQIKTVENAMKHVKTKYVIKSRVDFYFSEMENFMKEMLKRDDIISCISIYVRSYNFFIENNMKFHASDICYGGTFDIINKISMDEINSFCLEIGCSENKKFRHYCKDKMEQMNIQESYVLANVDNYSNFMSSIFFVYPINTNNSVYIFKDIKYFNDENRTSKEYFIYGCGS
jgi:hypothetical protein